MNIWQLESTTNEQLITYTYHILSRTDRLSLSLSLCVTHYACLVLLGVAYLISLILWPRSSLWPSRTWCWACAQKTHPS